MQCLSRSFHQGQSFRICFLLGDYNIAKGDKTTLLQKKKPFIYGEKVNVIKIF